MNYILGIDTTFHETAVALIDGAGKVILDKRMHIDYDDENADKFFSLHSKNLHHILGPIIKNFINKVFLIAVSNKGGMFHSLPVGVNAANILSSIYKKKLIGISHEAAHLYSNWIGRKGNEFQFPAISLNISGAHGNIWLIRDSSRIQKIKEIVWHKYPDKFPGLGAFFHCFLVYVGLPPKKRGEGGGLFSDLASKGKIKEIEEFRDIKLEDTSREIFIKNLDPIENIIDLQKRDYQEICNLAATLSDRLFTLLAEKTIDIAVSCGAKEIHLCGGVGHDPVLQKKMRASASRYGLDFKNPLKPKYYFDNAVMVALAGYCQRKFCNPQNVLDVQTDKWHFRNYINNNFGLS